MKNVFTPEQVAQVLGLSKRTVISWLQQGKLNGIKVGNRWRVREEDLDKFIDEPNMYFTDYIHRARFIEMQRRTQARDRNLISSIYILSSLSKPLDEFMEEGSMDVDAIRRATRFWGPLERALVQAALCLYDPTQPADINEVFSPLDSKGFEVMMQALRLRW
ncbi:MAG TPA: helix-turn-helix domain-containing protein [Firmicutes bacterium]|nr:helix-turn-helix domain-containing protein [Candidatus Fermentithermobacillaceae bacterium]